MSCLYCGGENCGGSGGGSKMCNDRAEPYYTPWPSPPPPDKKDDKKDQEDNE